MMKVRMVDVKLYSIIRLNVVVQNMHRSLDRDALDSCDFYQLSPGMSPHIRLKLMIKLFPLISVIHSSNELTSVHSPN